MSHGDPANRISNHEPPRVKSLIRHTSPCQVSFRMCWELFPTLSNFFSFANKMHVYETQFNQSSSRSLGYGVFRLLTCFTLYWEKTENHQLRQKTIQNRPPTEPHCKRQEMLLNWHALCKLICILIALVMELSVALERPTICQNYLAFTFGKIFVFSLYNHCTSLPHTYVYQHIYIYLIKIIFDNLIHVYKTERIIEFLSIYTHLFQNNFI